VGKRGNSRVIDELILGATGGDNKDISVAIKEEVTEDVTAKK
jgi:hypothetical protein